MPEYEVKNYYEAMVFDEIQRALVDSGKVTEEDMMADIACLALNRLPPRYVRFAIDTAFFMEPEDRAHAENDVQAAVQAAYAKVRANPRRD